MRSASATDVPPNFMTTVAALAAPVVAREAPDTATKDSFRLVPEPGQRAGVRRLLSAAADAPLWVMIGAFVLIGGAIVGAGLWTQAAERAALERTRGAQRATEDDDATRPRVEIPDRRGGSFLGDVIPPAPARLDGAPIPRAALRVARRLSLERKVGQLMLFTFEGQDVTASIFGTVRDPGLGGLAMESANYVDPAQLMTVATELTEAALQGRPPVAPFIVAAQEGGEFSALGAFPPARTPAELGSAREAAGAARQTVRALKPLGLNGVLAPVLDVGSEFGIVGERAYSDDPDKVAAYARATVRTYNRARMLSVAKHFPGLGAAPSPTDAGPASVGLSIEELEARDLVPFRAAIDAGAPAVMLGHGLYATDDSVTPASLSPTIATDLLRRRLRFRGLAVTDNLAAGAITATTSVGTAGVRAIRAGADLLYVSGRPQDRQAVYGAVLRAARSGKIDRERLNEAVLRNLRTKAQLGLIR